MILLLSLTGLLQASLLSHLSGGNNLDLTLVLVVSWSLLRGPREAILWGFIGGLVLDLLSGWPTGLSALLLTLIATLISLGQERFYRGLPILPLGAMVVASLLYHTALLLVGGLLGRRVDLLSEISNSLVPALVANLVATPFLYYPLRALHRRLGPPRLGW
ncbi:MAG: rod shape-determining protein MreD [Chloroflexi bacterium]|nr:rod shape-determining protein MreD [Chloroflexota bacterium]